MLLILVLWVGNSDQTQWKGSILLPRVLMEQIHGFGRSKVTCQINRALQQLLMGYTPFTSEIFLSLSMGFLSAITHLYTKTYCVLVLGLSTFYWSKDIIRSTAQRKNRPYPRAGRELGLLGVLVATVVKKPLQSMTSRKSSSKFVTLFNWLQYYQW